MKKLYYTQIAIFLTLSVFCQDQIAVTESGKKVVLHKEGTWEYSADNKDCSFNPLLFNNAKSKIISGQNFEFYYNKAWEHIKNNGEQSYDAIANFEHAQKLAPQNGGLYSDLGNCYRGGLKCFEKAEYLYTKAIENGFEKGFVYYNRAICKYELGKMAEMRADLEMSGILGWYNDYYKLYEK